MADSVFPYIVLFPTFGADKMHLQNCMTCTKLFFNPSCDEAVKLKKRYMFMLFKHPALPN